jgi:hypothetical protein
MEREFLSAWNNAESFVDPSTGVLKTEGIGGQLAMSPDASEIFSRNINMKHLRGAS